MIIELTIPFEMNIDNAHQRKITKYQALVHDLEDKGYVVKFYAVEIGSRGFVSKDNFKRLKSIFHELKSKISIPDIRSQICKNVLTSSFVIYYSKYDLNWTDPALMSL